MRWTSQLATAVLLSGTFAGPAQTAGAPGCAPQAAGALPQAAADESAAIDTRTEKQKALVRQTEQLFAKATELKVEVDKTNKNILSLRVVRDAEEIEKLAKGIRERARR